MTTRACWVPRAQPAGLAAARRLQRLGRRPIQELKGLRRQLNKREIAASPADDDEDAT